MLVHSRKVQPMWQCNMYGSIFLYFRFNIYEEDALLHYIATLLLIHPLVYFPGAYYVAYNHLLKVIELEPDDWGHQELLLFFHEIPDQIVKKEEAIEIARNILKVYPESGPALSIINELET